MKVLSTMSALSTHTLRARCARGGRATRCIRISGTIVYTRWQEVLAAHVRAPSGLVAATSCSSLASHATVSLMSTKGSLTALWNLSTATCLSAELPWYSLRAEQRTARFLLVLGVGSVLSLLLDSPPAPARQRAYEVDAVLPGLCVITSGRCCAAPVDRVCQAAVDSRW